MNDNCYWLLDLNGGVHFNDRYVGPIDLPKTIKSCAGIFANCKIKEGCYLRHFNLTDVDNFRKMFYNATLPKGFHLGEEFDTRSVNDYVIDYTSMFEKCKFNEDFDFGDVFVVRQNAKVDDMFKDADIPDTFDLGDHFTIYDIRKVFGDRDDLNDLCERFIGISRCYTNVFYRRDKKGRLAFKAKEYVGPICLPEGITDCKGMFADCGIARGCYLENFDTSKVTDMSQMFERASLPDGFSFGDKFYTTNVENMKDMFRHCAGLSDSNFPSTFTPTAGTNLLDIFNKENVDLADENNRPWMRVNGEWRFNDKYVGPITLPEPWLTSCHRMFSMCDIKEGCYLKDFDTSIVEDMSEMFYHCRLPHGFALGDKFDTSAVRDMSAMFKECLMNDDFSLGNKFITDEVEDMSYMFDTCQLPKEFTLGENFNTTRVEDMTCMFSHCHLPIGFSLGTNFYTSECLRMSRMFYKAKLCHGFSLGTNFVVQPYCDCYELFREAWLPKCFVCDIHLVGATDVCNFDKMFDDTKFKLGFKLGKDCEVLGVYLP